MEGTVWWPVVYANCCSGLRCWDLACHITVPESFITGRPYLETDHVSIYHPLNTHDLGLDSLEF